MIEPREVLFSYLFGMAPWDVRRLTYVQLRSYATWIDQWVESQKKQGSS